MKEYNEKEILENYGKEALEKVEQYMNHSNANMLLIYAEDDVFEIISGITTNHSMSIDNAIELLDIDMDIYADEHHWDGWNYDALNLINI